jgi:hypothetical protein
LGEKRKGQWVGMSEWQGEGNEFQNGNCWYTPRLFSYEWQIQDLQVTSLYEWQVKELKQLCFQRIASDLYVANKGLAEIGGRGKRGMASNVWRVNRGRGF